MDAAVARAVGVRSSVAARVRDLAVRLLLRLIDGALAVLQRSQHLLDLLHERALGLLYEAETKGCTGTEVLDALPVVADDFAAALRGGRSGARQRARLLRVLGVLAHRGGEFLQRRGGLLERRGVLGDPIVALERVLELARTDMSLNIVQRELITLSGGSGHGKPVLGMFLGGAYLADTMLYCRNKIYPLGLPNGVSHLLTGLALLAQLFLRLKANFLPPRPSPLAVSWRNSESLTGRFSLLAVTTLDKLLLSGELRGHTRGVLRLVAIDERPASVLFL